MTEMQLNMSIKPGAMAKKPWCSPSTILRELKRNGWMSTEHRQELDAIAWRLYLRLHKLPGFEHLAKLFTPDIFDFKQIHAALFALGA